MMKKKLVTLFKVNNQDNIIFRKIVVTCLEFQVVLLFIGQIWGFREVIRPITSASNEKNSVNRGGRHLKIFLNVFTSGKLPNAYHAN